MRRSKKIVKPSPSYIPAQERCKEEPCPSKMRSIDTKSRISKIMSKTSTMGENLSRTFYYLFSMKVLIHVR
jgi:hypothetical protein